MGRLQDQMKTDLLLKRYSPHTTRAYLRCIRDFAKYFMRSRHCLWSRAEDL